MRLWSSSCSPVTGPGRGAFINSFGELGGTSPKVANIVRSHKKEFQTYIAGLAKDIGAPSTLALLATLAVGTQITAAVSGSSEPAERARAAAEKLIDAGLSFGQGCDS